VPRVSICIPTFNRSAFIGRALGLALAQSEADVEVIVLDDGSTDGTFEIASSFDDPRVRVLKGERHLGLAENFNRALDAGTAAYVKILCDDDFLYPQAVSRLADALDRFPDATLATSTWNLLNSAGKLIKSVRLLKNAPADGSLVDLDAVVKSSYLWRNRIGSPSAVLLRRSAVAGLRFNSEYRQMMDWALWLQLLERGPLVFLPEVLSAYQWHSETLSNKQKPRAQTASDLLTVSSVLAASLPKFRGAVTKWDLKRLQILCLLDAIRVAARNALQLRWHLLLDNARIAVRALRMLVSTG
jgi:glycosyltransferase involved in cell wall biosynthesis